MNLETCLVEFMKDFQFSMGSQTLKFYQRTITRFFDQSEKGVDEITKREIRNWLSYLALEKGYKPSTINNHISALKLFFHYCWEEGLIAKNPAKQIKHVIIEPKLPRYLSNEQLTQLRVLLAGRMEERAIMEVLYSTGVRISELLAMKKEDINWTERSIVIPEGKFKIGRIVLFTSECAEHLKGYLDSRDDHLPFVFEVFNSDGTRSNCRNIVEQWFQYYSKQLGFKVTPHMMRHTFAAHLTKKGMPFEYIQVLLGHDSVKTTRVYARLYDHARKEMYDEWM